MRGAALLAALLAATLAASAQAQPRPPSRAEARRAFVDAVALFDRGHHAEALALFERAWTLSQQPLVQLNLAATHEALGHPLACLDALDRFEREASPATLAAHRAQVDAARARMTPLVGTLVLEGGPDGLRATVDGADTPREALAAGVRVLAGSHRLHLEAPGHRPLDLDGTVFGGDSIRVPAALVRATGPLSLRASIAGAAVRVDGAPRGTTPLAEALVLDEGPHTVRVEAADHAPFEETVHVGAAGVSLVVALAALPRLVVAPPRRLAPRPAPPSRAPAWALLGGGAAVFIGGAVGFGMAAAHWSRHTTAQDALEPAAVANAPGARVTYNAWADLIEDDHPLLGVAGAVAGVGLAAAVVGVVMLVAGPRRAARVTLAGGAVAF